MILGKILQHMRLTFDLMPVICLFRKTKNEIYGNKS